MALTQVENTFGSISVIVSILKANENDNSPMADYGIIL